MTPQEFFAQAINIERAAEFAYRVLVDIVALEGKKDAKEFFEQMVEYSRLHRESIMQQSGLTEEVAVAPLVPGTEVPLITTSNIPAGLKEAMEFALALEKQGVAFYEKMAGSAKDSQIKAMAEEFAAEERSHVEALERFMGLRPN
jgi:rubrerythrin